MAHHVDPFVAPAGCTSVFVQCGAQGANGQAGNNVAGGGFTGAGGGGGEYASGVVPVVPATSYDCRWSDALPPIDPGVGPAHGYLADFGSDHPPGVQVIAVGGLAALFPVVVGGAGGTGGTGDFTEDGEQGGDGAFANQSGGAGGDGGNIPGVGGAGGVYPAGDGGNGSQGGAAGGGNGGGGGGAANIPASGGKGGGSGPSYVRVWDNRDGSANGATNTPPGGGNPVLILYESAGAPAPPPFVPPNDGVGGHGEIGSDFFPHGGI